MMELKERLVEEVQEDEDWRDRDEERDRHASMLMEKEEGRMVKFERRMDVIGLDENENLWMRKVKEREKDWEWHFCWPEVLQQIKMFHFCLIFH